MIGFCFQLCFNYVFQARVSFEVYLIFSSFLVEMGYYNLPFFLPWRIVHVRSLLVCFKYQSISFFDYVFSLKLKTIVNNYGFNLKKCKTIVINYGFNLKNLKP